jgi:hypothetical protein
MVVKPIDLLSQHTTAKLALDISEEVKIVAIVFAVYNLW